MPKVNLFTEDTSGRPVTDAAGLTPSSGSDPWRWWDRHWNGRVRFRSTIFFLAVMAFLSPEKEALAQPETAAALWQRAQKIEDADSVVIVLRRLIDSYPRNPLVKQAENKLGDYYYARGNYPQAREHYHRVSAGWEGAEQARLGEARSYYALRDFSKARDLARALMQSEQPRIQWYGAFLVAQSWQAEGKLEESLSTYRRLLARSPGPGQPAALLAAAQAADDLDLERESGQLITILLEQYPDSPEAVEARYRAWRTGAGDAGDEQP